jgi:hypothetical protein
MKIKLSFEIDLIENWKEIDKESQDSKLIWKISFVIVRSLILPKRSLIEIVNFKLSISNIFSYFLHPKK